MTVERKCSVLVETQESRLPDDDVMVLMAKSFHVCFNVIPWTDIVASGPVNSGASKDNFVADGNGSYQTLNDPLM